MSIEDIIRLFQRLRKFWSYVKWNLIPLTLDFSSGPSGKIILLHIDAHSWLTGKKYFNLTLFRLEFVWRGMFILVILSHGVGGYSQHSRSWHWQLTMPLLNGRNSEKQKKSKISDSGTNISP
jgi:hypothetical protein